MNSAPGLMQHLLTISALAIGTTGLAGCGASAGAASASAIPPQVRLYRYVAARTVLVRGVDVVDSPDKVSRTFSWGTGVLIGPPLVPTLGVLTAFHVVEGLSDADDRLEILLPVDGPDGALVPSKPHVAHVVRTDEKEDLAWVAVDGLPPGTLTLALAPRDPLPGEPILAVGHLEPGMLWSVSACAVASVGRRAERESEVVGVAGSESGDARARELENQLLIQTDCRSGHGISGGPLVDLAGELLGIAIFESTTRWYTNDNLDSLSVVGFAVHLRTIRSFLRDVASAAESPR